MARPAADKRKPASQRQNDGQHRAGENGAVHEDAPTNANEASAETLNAAGQTTGDQVVELKPSDPDAEMGEPQRDHQPEKSGAGPKPPNVSENYRYWREHGGEWAGEYDQRKLVVPLYHVQEIMLTEYVAHHAPARVLEFGCGPGRHLRNLSRIPGVDAFGYDQSAAMVAGCLRWTNQKWIDEHVTVGLPTGRLPFEDGQFDLVYSAEVLVHVRPEDLLDTLSELMRIAKRQVFHLEPDEHIDIVSDDHLGCWKHDLVAAYAKLGKRCEILTSGYKAHAPYRVLLDDQAPTWEWPPLLASLYRRLETDLARGFTELRTTAEVKEREAKSLLTRVQALETAHGQAAQALTATRQELEQARAAAAQHAQKAAAQLAELTALTGQMNQAAAKLRETEAQNVQAVSEKAAMAGRLAEIGRQMERQAALVGEQQARIKDLDKTIEQLRATMARQLRVGREQVTALLGQIEADRARASEAMSAHQHILHRMKQLYPGR